MYSIALTDGKIINIDADEALWLEGGSLISLRKGGLPVALANLDNIVGYIKTDCIEQEERGKE